MWLAEFVYLQIGKPVLKRRDSVPVKKERKKKIIPFPLFHFLIISVWVFFFHAFNAEKNNDSHLCTFWSALATQ